MELSLEGLVYGNVEGLEKFRHPTWNRCGDAVGCFDGIFHIWGDMRMHAVQNEDGLLYVKKNIIASSVAPVQPAVSQYLGFIQCCGNVIPRSRSRYNTNAFVTHDCTSHGHSAS